MSVVPASWGPRCTWPVPRRGLCHVGAPCPWLRPSAPPPSLQLLPPQGHPWTPFPPSTEPRSFLMAPSQRGPVPPWPLGAPDESRQSGATCWLPAAWHVVPRECVSRCLALLSHLPPPGLWSPDPVHREQGVLCPGFPGIGGKTPGEEGASGKTSTGFKGV